MNSTDYKYLDLLYRTSHKGEVKDNRTEFKTRSLFGEMLHFDLSIGFPLLTTRFISFKISAHETLFFLKGETDTKKLEEKGITIWKGNTTREFLDQRGLHDLAEGDMGLGYGYQWRNFNSQDIDQVVDLLTSLKNNPTSRRHLITAWNPAQIEQMALPPCHILQQYDITDGKLNCMFTMRSVDVYHGLPYNIACYALLTFIFAKYLNLEPGTLVFSGGDVHVYENQLSVIDMQISKKANLLPKLNIKKDLNTIDDVLNLEFEDLELVDYKHAGKLPKVEMAV